MNLVHNERIKLTATCLNALAVTMVATGVVAPMVAIVFGFQAAGTLSKGTFVLAAGAWFVLGAVLHLLARQILGRLRE